MPKEYFVVFNGRNIGIYDSWPETEVQVSGFSNASYKGYNSWEAAKHAYLKFFKLKELPTTIHLPTRFHSNNEHLKQDDTCPSGCSRIIRGLEMELEQTRFQLEQTRREVEHSQHSHQLTIQELEHTQGSLRVTVQELQNAREVNDSFRDVISGFRNVNID
ncbi:Flavin-containing monooxygenase [Psidium guajava]|nr:Flavin-containing monooxygenase [Psidium guajava]